MSQVHYQGFQRTKTFAKKYENFLSYFAKFCIYSQNELSEKMRKQREKFAKTLGVVAGTVNCKCSFIRKWFADLCSFCVQSVNLHSLRLLSLI